MVNYSFLEVNTSYPIFLKTLYDDNSKNVTYQQAMDQFYNSYYCESNYIEQYLKSDFGIQANFICYNNTFAQSSWDDNPDKDLFNIFLRQLKHYNPDVIYISDINLFNATQIIIIKNVCKKEMKLVCYHFSFLTKPIQRVLPLFDLCFTGSEKFCNDMLKYNSNVKVIRHAFESTILDKIQIQTTLNKPAFIGSIFIGKSFHTNRIDALGMLKDYGISFDFYGNVYGSFYSKRQILHNLFQSKTILDKRKKTVDYLNSIKKKNVFGLNYYKSIGSYSCNINAHAPINGTGCGNQRMFEVTGIGSCLVTDYRVENSLLFDPDNEIVVYKNNEELVEKLKYLIDNPTECLRIAKNGQKRTLNNYTYKHKALQINDYIQELFI